MISEGKGSQSITARADSPSLWLMQTPRPLALVFPSKHSLLSPLLYTLCSSKFSVWNVEENWAKCYPLTTCGRKGRKHVHIGTNVSRFRRPALRRVNIWREWKPLWTTVRRFLKILQIELPCDPAIPLRGIYPKETKSVPQRDLCTPKFTAAFITDTKT